MNKALIFGFFLLISIGLKAQQSSISIKAVEPIRYEMRNGSLQLLSYIKLIKGAENSKAKLDGKKLEIIKTNQPDSVLVWLPLIGDKNTIELFSDKGSITKQIVTAPIPKDWGHFQNGTIHIIQSSHQDIAWMNTPEYCRNERIEDIIIPALSMMKEDSKFTFEMEQTLNLMEFLDRYPDRKDEVAKYLKEGRFKWGATYNQPYEGLSSGEQLIRQAYYGRKWIRENFPGCDDVTANNIDVPGRTLQMPQILAKSGIDYLFISRMEEGFYHWYSPDGSKVFTYTPGNYGWASMIWKFFDQGAVNAFNKLHHRSTLWSDYYRKHNIAPHYAVLISCDATKPINFKKIIDEWNAIADQSGIELPHLKNSTAEEFFGQVNQGQPKFEEIAGERPDLWLYIHGPAHYKMHTYKREAAILLPAAETFTTINALAENRINSYPRKDFDRAWMASIYPDHGLGGKNGHLTDQIFEDSIALGRNMGDKMLHQALKNITEKVNIKQNDVLVFNDLTWKRSQIAVYKPDFDPTNMVVKDDAGKVVPSQIVMETNQPTIHFYAENIPSIGYKSFSFEKGKTQNTLPEGVVQMNNYYENSFYKVLLTNGGIESLYDKQAGRELLETSKFKGGDILELGYTGNGAGEFTRIKDVTPGDIYPLSHKETTWVLVNSGALFSEYQNTQVSRFATIVQAIRIYHRIKKIDFNISLVDFTGEHNRQYRFAFPLRMDERKINYEVPMAVLEVGKDDLKRIPKGWGWDGTYTDRPEDSHPREIQNFISANGSGFGFTMSSCVAVADYIDPSREQANYPVLQAILLSSHKSCHGEGNWYEQKGTHQFNFSISSHEEGWKNGYHFGIEANHPLKVSKKENQGGSLEKEYSFLTISDPFVALSLIKKADKDSNIIIRLTEMQGRDTKVQLSVPLPVRKVIRTNLIEEEQDVIATSGTNLTLPLGKNAIETFKLIF